MAYKKSINRLTISKLKSKDLIEWFIGVATWKEISNVLDISHSKVFKFKRILRGKLEEVPPFDALADTFTVKELNDLITMYNDYLENPDNYKQNKKRTEIDLEAQTSTVNKHLAEMGSMKLETPKQKKSEEASEQEDAQESEKASEQEDVQESEKAPEQEDVQESEDAPKQEDKETQKELLERHNKDVQEERNYIDEAKDVDEKKKREINFNSQKPMRIHEFWQNKKKK